ARGRIAAALDRAETQLRRTGDPRERAVKERALGILKGRAASFLPERADLAAHRKDPPVELYHAPALQALREAPEGPAALTQARERVAAAAKAVGIDPAAFLARHEAGGPLDAGTAAAWLAEELVSVMKARGLDPERAGTADRRSAAEAIDRLHGFAETRFHEVARAIGLGADRAAPGPAAAVANRPEDPQAAELNLLYRQARNAIEKSRTRPASPAEREAQIRFAAVVEARLSKADLDRLQQGDARAIAALAPTRLARATLALTWAEARHTLADAPTRARLERPLREAIREHAIAKALEAQAREKSLGKDREREK
ncbi:MAG TPA: hypothetical protein VFR34_08510, partial [Paracoccaceae bacterium]|nr:hypothetical protein [Paracoccaceae bacterium]